jgi:mannose-6-phosphate isomerase-like protein (cupin superfamily)
MPIDIYKTFTNPVSKESFRCISSNADLFVIEWKVQPSGYVPFEHIHLAQDEIFNIKKGELRVVIDGEEKMVKQGEKITVPKGQRHIAFNNKEEEMVCEVEYVPGLDHYKWMQCFAGITIDNYTDKKGGINIPKAGYCLKKMKAKCMTRPTVIPAPVFNFSLAIFYLMGTIAGWNRLFKKYTE